MEARRVVHIMVDLEAHSLRTDMKGVIAKDLVLFKEARKEVPNIIMMKEEVHNMPKKTQDMEVLGEVLPTLRLSMTGFEMMSVEAVGSQVQTPRS